jgi:hypothetical protein
MTPNQMRAQFEEHGFCVVPDALNQEEIGRARSALQRGVQATRESLGSTHIASLDPNDANIRVNNLPAIDSVFIELHDTCRRRGRCDS